MARYTGIYVTKSNSNRSVKIKIKVTPYSSAFTGFAFQNRLSSRWPC